jgi:hypothetical protein
MPSRRPVAIAGVIVVVLAVLVLTLPSVIGGSYQFVQHAECVQGAIAASEYFWTPVLVLNSPPNFNNSTSYVIGSGWAPGLSPAYLNLSSGESGGTFSLDHWILVQQHLEWLYGPGGVPSCPSDVATDLSRNLNQSVFPPESFSELLPSGSTSDVGVPHMFNMSAPNGTIYGSVYFLANYSDGYGNLSFASITFSDDLQGSHGYQSISWSDVGATFLVVVPFRSQSGTWFPFLTWVTGVVSAVYYMWAPWFGCIQWAGQISNPFGTGLSFGPPPTSGYQCSYP